MWWQYIIVFLIVGYAFWLAGKKLWLYFYALRKKSKCAGCEADCPLKDLKKKVKKKSPERVYEEAKAIENCGHHSSSNERS